MLVNSLEFLLFLPGVFAVYWLLCNRLHKLAYDLREYRTGERSCDMQALTEALAKLEAEFEDLYRTQTALWARYRTGLASPALDAQFAGYRREIAALREAADAAAFGTESRLDVVFCLPDQHGAPQTGITLFTCDGREIPVAAGCFKASDLSRPYFTYSFRVPGDSVPSVIRLAVSGFGGTGFAFLDMKTPQGLYRPMGIASVSGQAESPANILSDDSRAVCLGEPEVLRAFTYPELAQQESALSVHMYKTSD